MQIDILSLAAIGAAVFVYLDGRHRRKKTDSRLWFWISDLYKKHNETPPTPPDTNDSIFSKERAGWEGR